MRLWQDKKIKVRIKDVVTVQNQPRKYCEFPWCGASAKWICKKEFMNAGIPHIFCINPQNSEHNRLLIKEE